MKFTLLMMECLIFYGFWICHNFYSWIKSVTTRRDHKTEENKIADSNENCKRHFIHLYTTSGKNGRPVCYMDVYEIFSPLDERKFRYASSRGFPNKTYLRYNQSKLDDDKWMEYSTLTL